VTVVMERGTVATVSMSVKLKNNIVQKTIKTSVEIILHILETKLSSVQLVAKGLTVTVS